MKIYIGIRRKLKAPTRYVRTLRDTETIRDKAHTGNKIIVQ